ncbi:hypothetical protein FACS1894172_04370 [Spirochaetia bacterium]|nr:hypothetical protein FACS1894164_18040 [Spirochaetia bacterium]GHU30684.1 hypothetical protein FACS1894172_04370 [Spirochaetia bacterium]
MENIVFSKMNQNDFESMKKIICLFKEWKDIQFNDRLNIKNSDFENKIIEDTLKIIDILGERYDTKFWHPTKEELNEYWKKWYKLTFEEKMIESKREKSWDFDSWIDAIVSAEIILYDLIEDEGNYKISLEQLAWPSGGIEAMENLIKIYDGEIIQNDMMFL